MFQYANGFTYAVNDGRKEIMISFRQSFPLLDEKGAVEKVTSASVADIVLSREGLAALKQLLNEIDLTEED